jgi:hypothetical protein
VGGRIHFARVRFMLSFHSSSGHFMSMIIGDYAAGFLGLAEGQFWDIPAFDVSIPTHLAVLIIFIKHLVVNRKCVCPTAQSWSAAEVIMLASNSTSYTE